jgi:hypothetical protein
MGGQTCDWGPLTWTAGPGTAPVVSPEPGTAALPLGLGTPFTVGDLRVELVGAAFELPSSGGLVMAPADMEPGDVPLTLDLQVLSGGDAQALSDVDKWIVDGGGDEYPAASGLVGSNGTLTVTFLLPQRDPSLELHFETEESFDLSGVLEDLPGGEGTDAEPAPTTAGAGEYVEFCAVNRRLMDRGEEFEGESAEARAGFWQLQIDDTYQLVDLVPEDLRADMETYADAQVQFVDLLEDYDYDMTALLDDAGLEALDAIFLSEEVSAALGRVDEFTVAACPDLPRPTG